MDLLEQYVDLYLKERDKDPLDVADMRVTRQPNGFDALWWEFEVDIDNSYVTYTEVFRMSLRSEPKGLPATRHWKTLTSKTRLHVPVREVPDRAIVYTTEGVGPYQIHHHDGISGLAAIEKGSVATAFRTPDEFVSVPFYYARGEGTMAGEKLLAAEAELERWAADNEILGGLNRLVGGCKFDLWAASCAARPGWDKSIFDLPE